MLDMLCTAAALSVHLSSLFVFTTTFVRIINLQQIQPPLLPPAILLPPLILCLITLLVLLSTPCQNEYLVVLNEKKCDLQIGNGPAQIGIRKENEFAFNSSEEVAVAAATADAELIKRCFLFILVLYCVAPVLQTLARDICDDTIWALVASLLLFQISCGDNRTVHTVKTEFGAVDEANEISRDHARVTRRLRFGTSQSLGASVGLLAGVCMSSRVFSHFFGFAVLCSSILWPTIVPGVLRPLLASTICARGVPNGELYINLALVLLLGGYGATLMWQHSRTAVFAYFLAILLIKILGTVVLSRAYRTLKLYVKIFSQRLLLWFLDKRDFALALYFLIV